MFGWFWEFLYSISEILFEVIDGLLTIANKVIGVEPIQVGGKDVSFINTLLGDNRVRIGFIGAGLIGIFLLMIFSTIAICRNMKDGKKSNGEIVGQVFKTLGLFLLVPALMFGFSSLLNVLVQLIFNATKGGTQTMGKFLFDAFRPVNMGDVQAYVDWRDITSVKTYLGSYGYSLSDYRFFFSWLVCLPLLFFIARSMFLFVDRTLSIIILFIFSPISMSTSVLDDGARFKIWRDKIISKFISGYGMIIAINIYIIVLSFITRGDVVFIPGTDVIARLCNFLLKCAFAIGGAFFLPKVFGLVGDLFVNGGGSGEFRDYDSSISEIKQVVRELKMNSRDNKRNKALEEQNKRAAAKGGSSGGGAQGNSSVPSGNLFNKKANTNVDIGKKVADTIKNEPQNNNNNDEKNKPNDKNFKDIFGFDKKELPNYQKGEKVAGGNIVKNNVSNIIEGSNKDNKEEKK